MQSPFSIAIHGGAGTILRTAMTAEMEQAYRKGLQTAMDAGYLVLENGGTALDAVTAATVSLEDCPLFNAGKGSVFTHEGTHEMDASIMSGKDLSAGAVAGVDRVKNPVILAREVMLQTPHVLLCGTGAMAFAQACGVALESAEYFYTDFRHQQWLAVKDSSMAVLDHSTEAQLGALKEKKFGTVGAVALDQHGHLAAATSTGGMTNKQFGRVGDSPLIGAGTWADDSSCAISCTGHGELFMKAVAAYDVHARMLYKGLTLEQAMHETVHEKLVEIGGEGGMIGVDKRGTVSLMFNSDGMYRGFRHSDGRREVRIYRD